MPIKISYNGNETVSKSDSKKVIINCKGKTMEENVLVDASNVDTRYDDFWDNYQNYGKHTYYPYMFAGQGWDDETFKPKYDIKPVGTIGGIARGTGYLDMKQRLLDQGVTLDTSRATNFQYAFAHGHITSLPKIDCSAATAVQGAFSGASKLTNIDELVVTSSLPYANTFDNCTALTNIRISGTIGNNLNMQSCPLNKDSITSVVNALSATTSDKTLTLSEAAVNAAFETSEGANDGSTSIDWTTLESYKPNWTISLV